MTDRSAKRRVNMTGRRPANRERSFGISVGTVLLVLAAYLLWRGRFGSAELTATIGALLLVLGVIRPTALNRPTAIWWRASRVLGYVNARVLLTVIFMLVFVPIGLVCRATGLDPLRRHRSTWPGWSPHPLRYRDRGHYSRMY